MIAPIRQAITRDDTGEDLDAHDRFRGLAQENLTIVGGTGDEMGQLQNEGRHPNGDRLSRFGDEGIDPEERAFAPDTGTQFVFIRHLGKQNIGQGLRPRQTKPRPAPHTPVSGCPGQMRSQSTRYLQPPTGIVVRRPAQTIS